MDQPEEESARTVADVAALWLKSNPAKRVNTATTDANDVHVHIVPAIGSHAIGDVKPATIQRLVSGSIDGSGPRKAEARKAPGPPAVRTVRRRYLTLQSIFNYAADNDWISRSPCRKIKGVSITSMTPRRSYRLSDDEVRAIAEATVERLRPMVWIAALTGLRWEEVAALRGNNLDASAGTLTRGRDGDPGRARHTETGRAKIGDERSARCPCRPLWWP